MRNLYNMPGSGRGLAVLQGPLEVPQLSLGPPPRVSPQVLRLHVYPFNAGAFNRVEIVPGLELFCGNAPAGFDIISLHSIKLQGVSASAADASTRTESSPRSKIVIVSGEFREMSCSICTR